MYNECLTAKITNTMLGIEDHGILTIYIMVAGDGWGCGFGGYSFDHWDPDKKRCVGSPELSEAITQILETLDVESWEQVKGQYVRVIMEGNKIKKIGNILKDKWFCFEDIFS